MFRSIALLALLFTLAGCASTEFKTFDNGGAIFEGKGGSKVLVDGMEVWDNGEPPRKFRVIGILEDERPGGVIPMAKLRSDMVAKAKEAGGNAIIQISSDSPIHGSVNTGGGSVSMYGNTGYYRGSTMTVAARKNYAKFAVITYVD